MANSISNPIADHRPLRLFALTFGGDDSASTQYRLFQYRGLFAEAGIDFQHAEASKFDAYEALNEFDVILLQKTLLATSKVKQIRQHARRFLYDADDRIWLSPQKKHNWLTRLRIEARLRNIARQADQCVAANEVIAGDLRQRQARVTVVPMAVDGSLWPKPGKVSAPLTIGWSGSPKNLPFLRGIAPALIEVQQRHPEVRWAFHCGQAPNLDGLRHTHIPYRAGGEPEAVGRFHIGLVPLPDDPFTAGKSPIKALQYFASEVAVVGSPLGATREILHEGRNALWAQSLAEWTQALVRLVTNNDLRTTLAHNARQDFETRYETRRVFPQLRDVLTGSVGQAGSP